LLESPQKHDLHQAADVERRGGRIEADIAGHHLPLRQGIQARGVSKLVDVAAFVE
jgi:hypothetical protein